MLIYSWGLKKEFETAVVNEPSVLEPLKFTVFFFFAHIEDKALPTWGLPLKDRRMDDAILRPFISISIIPVDGRVLMKGCVLWNPINGWKDFRLQRVSNPGFQDQQASD